MRFSLGRKFLANSCVASAAISFDQEFRKSLILPPQTASVKKIWVCNYADRSQAWLAAANKRKIANSLID